MVTKSFSIRKQTHKAESWWVATVYFDHNPHMIAPQHWFSSKTKTFATQAKAEAWAAAQS